MNPPIPKMTTNSFFSGVGGLDYGLELAGFKTVSMCKLRDLGQRAIKLKEDQASGRLVIVRGPEDITLTNAGGAVSPEPYQSMTVAGIGQASGVTPRDGSPDSDWPTPDGVGCQESARVAPPVTIREAD